MDKLKAALKKAMADERAAMDSLSKLSQARQAAEKAICDATDGDDNSKQKAIADAIAEINAAK